MATLKGRIEIDSSQAVAAFQKVASEGDKATKQVADSFKKSLSGAIKPSDGAKAFDGIRKAAQDAVAEQKSALAALIASGNGSGKAFEAAKEQLIAASKEARRLDDALEQVNKEVDGVNNKKITIGDQLREGLKGGLSGGILGGVLGGGIAGVVTQAVGAVTEGIKKVVEIGQEFETGMASLSAVTGATGPLLTELGENAKGLAKQFGGSVTDQLNTFQVTLSKIGPQLANSPQDLAKFAENVNLLSKTDSALGAAGAVDALTASMLQFGIDVNNSAEVAKESSRFINVLAASAGVGSASVSDVAAAIGVVGSTAKNANQSFEETNAALQVLASKALVGAPAGTALTAVINKLQGATGPAADQLKGMGTSVQELGQILTTQGIGAAMAKMREAMDTLGSTSEKNAFLTQFFGETGLNAANALLGGADKLKEFTEGVTGTNAATEQAATNMNTLGERISRAKAGLEVFAIGAFDAVKPFINGLFDAFDLLRSTLGPVLSKTFDSLKGVFERLLTVVKPILALLGASIITNIVGAITVSQTILRTLYDVAIKIFDGIVNALKPIKEAFESAFGSIGEGIDPVELFTEALNILTTVISEAGAFVADLAGVIVEFTSIPLRLISEGVAFLVGLFGSQSKETKNVADATTKAQGPIQLITKFFDNLRGTMAGVTAVVREVGTVLVEFFTNLKNLDFDALGRLWETLGGRISGAYDKGFNGAVDAIRKARDETAGAGNDFKAIEDKIVAFASKAPTLQLVDFNQQKKNLADLITAALNGQRVTSEQAKQLEAELAAIRQKGGGGSAASLASRREEFQLQQALIEGERRRHETAIKAANTDAQGKLTKEGQRLLDREALASAQKLEAAYRKVFGIAEGADVVSRLNFKTAEGEDPRRLLADLSKELADLADKTLEAQLKVNATGAFDSASLVTSAKEALGLVEEAFKESATQLGSSLIDPNAFFQSVEKLKDSLKGQLATLESSLTLITDEKQLGAVEDIIKQLQKRISDLDLQASDAATKSFETTTKDRIRVNKDSLELLKADEEANREAIADLLRENLALETDLKLRSLQTTGELRDRETQIILEQARRQREEIDKLYAAPLTGIEKIAQTFVDSVSQAFEIASAERIKAREEALAALRQEEDDLTDSLHNKETSIQEFYRKQAELKQKADAEGRFNIFDTIKISALKTAEKTLQKFADAAIEKFERINEKSSKAFSKIGEIALFTFGTSLAGALAKGKDAVKGLLSSLATAAVQALDLLIPVISAQFLGFLGPFALPLAAVAIQTIKALMNEAAAGLGADKGVVGLDRNYQTRRSSRDVVPVWMRYGESAIVPEATAKNKDILEYFNKTHGRWQDYALQNLSFTDLKAAFERHKGSLVNFETTPRTANLDISSNQQVVVLQANNAVLERKLDVMTKEIKKLKHNITERREVISTIRVDPDGLNAAITSKDKAYMRGH
jgi:TP901 family phage tail tape measure protein